MSAKISPHRSIVFFAWGEKYVEHVNQCISESKLPSYPIYLLCDEQTCTENLLECVTVIRCEIEFTGKLAKVELLSHLPKHLETVLFLDVDTIVLDDISLGFEKAEKHGMAMAPAPHYSLENFREFGVVMDREGVPRQGQLLYNSGVMFFDSNSEQVQTVFHLACEIAEKDEIAPWGDQTYITLAMELVGLNPYTLSSSFNHRAFGGLLSGSLRIWHSYKKLPPAATELESGFLHRYDAGKMIKAKRVPL